MNQNESLGLIRADLTAHAKSITALIEDQRDLRNMIHQIQVDRAAKAERDVALNERLERMSEDIRDLRKVGLWVLGAFVATFIAAIANFIIQGGLAGG